MKGAALLVVGRPFSLKGNPMENRLEGCGKSLMGCGCFLIVLGGMLGMVLVFCLMLAA
jgi:hypothetical protein